VRRYEGTSHTRADARGDGWKADRLDALVVEP
jgi:hypothetical protein